MLVEKVEIRMSQQSMTVTDCFVDKGLTQGGHSALPDIDVDFASDRRQEIKNYLEERYNAGGRQRVFSAGTYSSMKLKAVMKDVSRVYRIPVSIVNYITAIFSDEQDWTDLFLLAATNKKVRKFILDYPDVIEDMRFIMGQPRSASIHASAIIVTPETKDGAPAECFDFLPIRETDGMLVSEFDGVSVDEIGLLKEDVLATKELTKLNSMIELVNTQYGKFYSVESITQNEVGDQKTFQLLSQGYTQNIFQFSSKGITRFIMDVQPSNIEDLIAINALYRPATLEIGATEDYVRFKRGETVPVYDYGTYEITKNTFGIMCYQEQFMMVAHQLGGFDLGKTDYLRKAIGKKNADLMATLKADFITGATGNGCPEYEAEKIWGKIEIAGKYSFNRSHAAAYALTAFCGAFLKANYPTAFYTIALQWADDKEIPALMAEMENCSRAKIMPPDINRSEAEFYTDYSCDEIYWSLGRIKMLGLKTVDYIIDERRRNGEFDSLENFMTRIFRNRIKRNECPDSHEENGESNRIAVNVRHIKNLILSGCFDQVEKVKAICERYSLLIRAAELLGFKLSQEEFPTEMTEKHYFWSMQQINISGIGAVDYERIYHNSDAKRALKGKACYLSLQQVSDPGNEGKRAIVCATVTEVEENGYKDRESGERKVFCKLKLQQNNDLTELVVWNDFYTQHKDLINGLKNKMIIVSCMVKYSSFTGNNSLQTYKSSYLCSL